MSPSPDDYQALFSEHGGNETHTYYSSKNGVDINITLEPQFNDVVRIICQCN